MALADPLATDLAAIETVGRDLGVVPGDPAYPFMRALLRLLGDLGRRLDAHDAAARETAEMIAKTAGPQIATAITDAARRTNEYRTEEALQANRRWFIRTGLGVAVGVTVAAAAGGYAGWQMHEGRFQAQVNDRVREIEGIGFIAQLAEYNGAAALREQCDAHAVEVSPGLVKCALPEVVVRAPASAKRAPSR